MNRTDRLILAIVALIVGGVILGLRLADRTAFGSFFDWPDGGVWSNLLASLLLGAPALLAILRRIEKHHAAARELAVRHHAEVMAKIGGS